MTPEQLKKVPWIPPMFKPLERNMLDLDSPNPYQTASTRPQSIHATSDRADAGPDPSVTNELLERAVLGGGMDVIADFALPLPLTMIGRILGVPAQDNQRFHRWSKTLISAGTSRNFLVLIPSIMSFMGYLKSSSGSDRHTPKTIWSRHWFKPKTEAIN